MIKFGETTEEQILETINEYGFETIFFWLIISYVLALVLGGLAGWIISNFTRVATLKKLLAETGKIEGEVSSLNEVLLNRIRASRDSLVEAERLLKLSLVELHGRLA